MDQARLDRIRLLSSRFRELQGLRLAWFGATIALVLGSYVAVESEPTPMGVGGALLASSFIVMAGTARLKRYYDATFGRQQPSPPARLQTVGLLVTFSCLAGWLAPLGATAAIVGIGSLWVVIRDWPWRAYYLAATAAVVVSVIASVSTGASFATGQAMALTYILFGVSFVPIGLLDHRLLVKLMDEARAPEVAAAASRSGSERPTDA